MTLGKTQRRWRRPPLLLIVALILAGLLPVLGYLQYRWLGAFSEREREQMQANLQRSLDAFRQDFDREIARIYLQFEAAPQEDANAGKAIAITLDRWNDSAPFPRLIGDIFWQHGGPPGAAPLERWDPATREWKTADWTKEFGEIREETRRVMRFSSRGQETVIASGLISTRTPALSIPIALPSALGAIPIFGGPVDYAIVRLNIDFLKSEIIPHLVQKHFSHETSDYYIEIRDADFNVIYPDDPSAIATADAETSVLGLPVEEYRSAVPLFTKRVIGKPGEKVGVVGGAVVGGVVRRGDVFVAQSEGPGFALPPSMGRFTYRIDRPGEPPDLLIAPLAPAKAQPTGLWQVRAAHRSGSLDAAVEQGRRRNLAAAFGILALLGASMAIALVSASRAQRLARQQIEFVSTVSHELRTPLAVICSAGENLADGLVRDPERLQNYGKLIRDQGRRLTETVEQALGFASLQSGLKRYALAPAAVRPIIDSAITALDNPIREGAFTIQVEVPENLPAVLADIAAIGRALQNLIGNAIKYSRENRWIGIHAAIDGGRVRIAVADRGAGIAASDLPHIFKPFYRGREALAAQIQGNGLGLSLVEEIVQAHGGTVEVQSGPSGSTFTIVLPAADDGSPS